MLVQWVAPTKSWPFAISMREWLPSEMIADPVTRLLPTSMVSSRPQVVAKVVEPVQLLMPGGVGGVPATYSVVPDSRPKVAPSTGIVTVAVLLLRSRTVTLAAVPLHSGPQFKTYAVASSALNTAH